ncbi:MAG: acyltransferase [Nanoarchaeota archaeon]
MEKRYHGLFKEYAEGEFIPTLLEFLQTDHKILVVEYKGKHLNSLIGFQADALKSKIPLRFILRLIGVQLFRKPLFQLLRMVSGGEWKNRLYRLCGMKIGKEVYIASDVYIDPFLPELITIGDGTIIGEHATILTHEFTIKHARYGRVHIGEQVLVGAFSIIRGGITIGDRAIIAMDSLINKDVPGSELVGGIPEHEIKKLKKLI